MAAVFQGGYDFCISAQISTGYCNVSSPFARLSSDNVRYDTKGMAASFFLLSAAAFV
jgi:hypothetical protein